MKLQGSGRRKRAALRQFLPVRGITIVSQTGILALPPTEVTVERVGWKAFGQCCLPAEWVPPFFLVNSSIGDTERAPANAGAQISECLRALDLRGSLVHVRSSGTSETIEQRGRLISETCPATEVLPTIARLSEQLPPGERANVHWVVQKYVKPLRRGHPSNERRVSREPRDFVAEFELHGEQAGYTAPVAVRHWRDGDVVTDFDLSCSSEPAITLKLKAVALWASGLGNRMLFEWVWSGDRVWVVQADPARPRNGLDPAKLRPEAVPEISPKSLQVFRIAGPNEFNRYGKLRNAQTYTELGYHMPTFYVMDNANVMQQILSGESPPSLEHDLKELTRRPLIIRTDGVSIPKVLREMLPRSEGLGTLPDAKHWLLKKFPSDARKSGIASFPMCLIAHHFIPSVSAAWARAEPGSNVVRIESLWGVPEGLYWHSHDTYEVDPNKRSVRKRLRFKGTFLAPDSKGRWVHCQPAEPHDWGQSVRRKDWLIEIARTTKKVAVREKRPVSLMWFVDNDPRASPHRVLPWYHTESAIGAPKAAPRHKLTTASDFKIETSSDWEQLKEVSKTGRIIERIRLEPRDPELVRNPDFARELAKLAAVNNIVIELAGGVLSHAYFILQRHGARVECVDLFGAEEEEVEYNKLVRDKIPEMIKRKGEAVDVVRLTGEALLAALREKLVEESFEALDARSAEELLSELADVKEVIDGICLALGVQPKRVDIGQKEKRKRRGGFQKGVMLRRTSSPHSLSGKSHPPQSLTLTKKLGAPPVIHQPSEMPKTRRYRRPDLRSVDQHPEGLLTFETELSKLNRDEQAAVFEIAIGKDEKRAVKLSVQISRHRSSLRNQIRVRLEPSQLSMKLAPDSQMQLGFEADTPAKKPRK